MARVKVPYKLHTWNTCIICHDSIGLLIFFRSFNIVGKNLCIHTVYLVNIGQERCKGNSRKTHTHTQMKSRGDQFAGCQKLIAQLLYSATIEILDQSGSLKLRAIGCDKVLPD
jgi:hypothetical protein